MRPYDASVREGVMLGLTGLCYVFHVLSSWYLVPHDRHILIYVIKLFIVAVCSLVGIFGFFF